MAPDGVISVGFDDSELKQGIREANQVVVQETGKMGKATDDAAAKMDKLGAASEKTAARVKKSMQGTGQSANVVSNALKVQQEKTQTALARGLSTEAGHIAWSSARQKQHENRLIRMDKDRELWDEKRIKRNADMAMRYERKLADTKENREQSFLRKQQREVQVTADQIMRRAIYAPAALQGRIQTAVTGAGATQMQQAIAGGMTRTQAARQQLAQIPGLSVSEVAYLAGGRGKTPLSFMDPASAFGKVDDQIQRMGRMQSQAIAEDVRRLRQQNREIQRQYNENRKQGRTQLEALAEDARRTAEVDRKVQNLGRWQSGAIAEDDRRTQRMGRWQVSAIGEDQMRTQRMGRWQAGAIAEDDARTQRMGRWQASAILEDTRLAVQRDREIQKMGKAQAAAIAEDQRRSAQKGGGGFFGGIGRRLAGLGGGGVAGSLIGGALGGFGIGLGGYALANAASSVAESAKQATAYERQMVAARELAGSQKEVNDLLDAYTRASGGAVNKVTTLANTTRLLATGFAETVPEMEKFVRATRGASIALGKDQDYVIQETQLAISNTSVKRLDQIGLGIEEVNDRIEQLRATNKGWSRETAFQDAVLGLLDEKYGTLTHTIEGQATGMEKLRKSWADMNLTLGQNARGPLNQLSEALSKILQYYTDISAARQMAEKGGSLPAGATSGQIVGFEQASRQREVRRINEQTADNLGLTSLWGMMTGRTQAQINATRFLANEPIYGPRGDTANTSGRTVQAPKYNEDQLAVRNDYYAQMESLEKDFANRRIAAILSYENQRSSIIREYGKSMVREEEDFARSRARSLRDYERSVMDLMRDAQEREAEMQEDLDDKLSDLKEDSNKKLKDLEEKYQKDREKDEKDHLDRLLKAAGALDAIAVLEERKRWAKEGKEKEEQHKEAVADEKEALQERIDDALEAHQERLEDARKADEKRLEDMRVARERQLADEDEDRGIRLARSQQDHDDQLAEMDRQHQLTMGQLVKEEADQRKLLQDALAKDLADVGVYVAGYHKLMLERDKLIAEWFEAIIRKVEDDILKQAIAKSTLEEQKSYDERLKDEDPNHLTPFATGGPVNRTGPAMLHAGEYILSKAMMANGYNPTKEGGNSYQNSRSINIQPGAISVQTTPGMESLVGELIEEQVIRLLERI